MTDEEMRRVIGENIRRILRDKRRTQTWLAKEIGSTRESIGQSIAGKAAISIKRVCDIAEALEVPVTEFLLDADEREALAIGLMATDDYIRLDIMRIIGDLDDSAVYHLQRFLSMIT